jgi:hypothetical protein
MAFSFNDFHFLRYVERSIPDKKIEKTGIGGRKSGGNWCRNHEVDSMSVKGTNKFKIALIWGTCKNSIGTPWLVS